MDFKERVATVIWWLGVVVALGFFLFLILGIVDVVSRLADGGEYQTR